MGKLRFLILLPVLHLAGPQSVAARDIVPSPLTEHSVIDERIDFHAQKSIARLSRGSMDQRYTARYLLINIRNFDLLGGIYIVNQGVPALRARDIGENWWTLLKGQDTMCWKEPAGEPPLILMSKTIVNYPAELDRELVNAFNQCGFRELEVIVRKTLNGVTATCPESIVDLISDEHGEMGCRGREGGTVISPCRRMTIDSR